MAASVGAWKEAEREKPGFSGRKDRREYTDTTVENALGVLSRDEYKTKIKTKGERDFDSLAKISAFTIQGKEEYKDELTQILNESEGAVDGAQEENLGTVVTKYMDKLQALYESVE